MNKYIDDLGTWVLTRGDENEKHSTEEGSVVMSLAGDISVSSHFTHIHTHIFSSSAH